MNVTPTSGASTENLYRKAAYWRSVRQADKTYKVYCGSEWVWTTHDADSATRFIYNMVWQVLR